MKLNNTLVIEDSKMDQYILKFNIAKANLTQNVDFMFDAVEALKFLNTKDEEDFPELIFLDLNLPVLNGFQFLEKFESFSDKKKEKCKVVVLSSSEDQADIERARNNKHVVEYFTKPINAEKMSQIIKLI